ncbi:MAG: methionine ABC transporter permease [Bacillota bacterium]|nr:methionine ABC transporter permease [Bacillota bacterium]
MPDLTAQLLQATLETLHMVGLSLLLAVAAGLPLGTLLVVLDHGLIAPMPVLQRALAAVVNVGRSVPFLILMVALIPFTRWVAGTSIGTSAAVVPMAVGATPYVARLVEGSLRAVDRGAVEAVLAMGASSWQVVWKVLWREALPDLVLAITVAAVSLVEYSAVAGAVGGGGLGDLAYRYGYQRYEVKVLLWAIVVLVVLVQVIQFTGDRLSRRLDHRG